MLSISGTKYLQIKMEGEIVNRVAASSLVTLDLEDWYDQSPKHTFDLAQYLFQGLILKELDFRLALKNFDWNQFDEGNLCVFCSADAVIPTWAYMLVASLASGHAKGIFFCQPENLDELLYDRVIQAVNPEDWRNKKVIIKGCSKYPVPKSAYVAIVERLSPVVQSLMYGEACSNVPILKRKVISNSIAS